MARQHRPPGLRVRLLLVAVACLGWGALASAGEPAAPFDLAGPVLDAKVTRNGTTLPITEVPNLMAGDRLWIHADLPPTQAAHYLLVVAFLRGATNPPPQSWFYPCETWSGKCAQQGLDVSVPDEAQQVLVFFAPATGGDLRTLVSAVRGRPGAFVRTSQDLNQASLDRERLERYLAAVRRLNASDPGQLKDAAPLLARSLAIKVDEKCLDRSPALQAPCLMQGQSALILNDGHSTSIVEALTNGPASDLAMEASFTPQLSYGYYSPYIASVLDIARIMDSFRTAQYQYIPALTAPQADQLALTLNTPPSFHNPKSVLVVALPAVEPAQLPPLHAVDPSATYCAQQAKLVLPVEGAPLVFSTGYAHQIFLTLAGKDGASVDLPAEVDPLRGGIVVSDAAVRNARLGDHIRGSLHGYWGFERYDGPSFELVNVPAKQWKLAAADEATLVVGRDKTVHLEASSVSCVDRIALEGNDGRAVDAQWKALAPDQLSVTLPLENAKPGALTLLVSQHGAAQPQPVSLRAFAEAARLDRFSIHAGDSQGTLQGSRLDEVAGLAIDGVAFVPGKLETAQGADTLAMVTRDTQPIGGLKPGDTVSAHVSLKDGRELDLPTLVEAPRPRVALISKSVQDSALASNSNIELSNSDELPQDSKLTFSVRAESPAAFARDEKIEVATADGTSSAVMSIASGDITLADAKVAVVTLDPSKSLGSSAFGPLQFRTLANGASGDWQPLATLVRLPLLKQLKCPSTPDLACKLSGSGLFLVEAVANDAKFEHPVRVPDGFPGAALPVPHPSNGLLYVRLRDDPAVISRASLEMQELPPSPDEVARAPARRAAVRPDAASSGAGSSGSADPGGAKPPAENTSNPGTDDSSQGAAAHPMTLQPTAGSSG